MNQPPPSLCQTRACRAALWFFATLGLALASAGVVVHHAKAYVDEFARDVGGEMLRYSGADQQDAQRTLVVNGLRIRVGSGGTPGAPRQVLDEFQARCRQRGIRFDAHPSAQAAVAAHRLPFASNLPLDGVLRLDDGDRGYLACLDTAGREVSPDELLQRARRFLADGDLSHLGELRFAMVERHGARTSYLAIWSEGAFPLGRAFPATGDAPGRDPAGVPRVPGTRRILSAWQADATPMVAIYRAAATTTHALADRYRRALADTSARMEATGGDADSLVVSHDAQWFLIAFVADGPDAIASVTPL